MDTIALYAHVFFFVFFVFFIMQLFSLIRVVAFDAEKALLLIGDRGGGATRYVDTSCVAPAPFLPGSWFSFIGQLQFRKVGH